MKDFITRMAERALGTAPRVDPQATSRYAPARLPLPESPLPDNTAAPVATLPKRSPVVHFDPQPEAAKNVAVASRAENDENRPDTVTPHRPRQPAVVTPVNELRKVDSALPAVLPETRAVPHTAFPLSEEPQVTANHPMSSFHDATGVDRDSHDLTKVDVPETSDDFRPEAVAIRQTEPYEAPASSPAKNETVLEPEIQKQYPSVRTRKIAEPIAIDSSVVSEAGPAAAEAMIASSSAEVPSADFAPLPENRQVIRATINANRAEPSPSLSNQPSYTEPERGRSVQIRIGRVEVRAEPPPPTAVEPVGSPAPRISLAEFLREHNRRRG